MKILIVNTSDIQGGAARAAYRLHKALIANNIDSQMLVQNKAGDDFSVIGSTTKTQKLLDRINPFIDIIPSRSYKNRSKALFSSSWFSFSNVVDRINKIDPDIVHLHWVCRGMIKVEDLARIKAPIIWSLHDMWAFTGGCHYNEGCNAYEKKCGNCKVLASDKNKDLSSKTFKRKQKTFKQKQDITIVGLSRWLNDASKNSALLRNYEHINLPNPIDTQIFKPFDKRKSRELWGLPINKKLILFGAIGATSDPRKGFTELCTALDEVSTDEVEFVVFGSSAPANPTNIDYKTHYVGCLSDDISLVTLYSAVDVMVVPSLQENLSNAIMESLACGTPVVGFDIGGNSDLIEPEKNGYLAQPFESSSLKYGIDWVLNNANYEELCRHARDKVLHEFDSVMVAKKYVELYKQVLSSH